MLFRSNNGLEHILFINSFCCVTVAPDQQSWHRKDGLGRKVLSYAEQQGLPGADKLLVTVPFFLAPFVPSLWLKLTLFGGWI